jgi:N-acetylmuramoyl-L-alanine amidase
MEKYRIYISPSNQRHNVGVGSYGRESDVCREIAKYVEEYLMEQEAKITVFLNEPEFDLPMVIKDSNALAIDYHLAIHSNASGSEIQGHEIFHHDSKEKGKEFAKVINRHFAKFSPFRNRGVKSDFDLYPRGLYELREIKATSALIEVGFHSNEEESEWIKENTRKIGKTLANAICDAIGIKFSEPPQETIKTQVRRDVMDRLTSRKFVLAVTTALTILLNEGLELEIPEETIKYLVMVISAYILGESIVDAGNKKQK